MSMRTGDTDLDRLIRTAEDQGWQVSRTRSGHVRFVPPDPTRRIVVSGGTSSDWRRITKLTSDLRRQGLVVEGRSSARASARRDLGAERARREALSLLDRAQAGDLESAAVLVDTLAYAGAPDIAEALALALQGRGHGRLGSPESLRGRPLMRKAREENIRVTLAAVRRALEQA